MQIVQRLLWLPGVSSVSVIAKKEMYPASINDWIYFNFINIAS